MCSFFNTPWNSLPWTYRMLSLHSTFFAFIKLFLPKIMITFYNVANIILLQILHKTLSNHQLTTGLHWLTGSKVVFRTFLATLEQTAQSYSNCISDCMILKRENILKTPSNKYWSFLPFSREKSIKF